jgi:hypothetical protein
MRRGLLLAALVAIGLITFIFGDLTGVNRAGFPGDSVT